MTRRDDEFDDLLADLGGVLDRLSDELDEREREEPDERARPGTRSRRRRRRSRPTTSGPRPPSPGDLLRFTEEYTIPTVISVLEATIQSLELVRGGLRLADPDRRARRSDDSRATGGASDRVARTLRSGATGALDRTLSDLRTALTATELPDDDDARSVLEDARELTAEIERRLAASSPESARRADRQESRRGSRGLRRDPNREGRRQVDIEVRDGQRADACDDRAAPGGSQHEGAEDDGGNRDSRDDEAPSVDVDAELESIRREVDGERDDEGANGKAPADAGESDDADEKSDDAGGESDDEERRDD